jgi:hypothetical protein
MHTPSHVRTTFIVLRSVIAKNSAHLLECSRPGRMDMTSPPSFQGVMIAKGFVLRFDGMWYPVAVTLTVIISYHRS